MICKPLQAGVLKGPMWFKGLFRDPRGSRGRQRGLTGSTGHLRDPLGPLGWFDGMGLIKIPKAYVPVYK